MWLTAPLLTKKVSFKFPGKRFDTSARQLAKRQKLEKSPPSLPLSLSVRGHRIVLSNSNLW